MNRKFIHTAVCISIIATMSACTADDTVTQALTDNEFIETITMNATDFEPGKGEIFSRTDVIISTSGGVFQWSENDTIGIFPDEGFQTAFPIAKENAGTNTAKFDGGGWALRQNHHYSAYYPFIKGMHFTLDQIPVSFYGQCQNGDNSTKHIGKYDFMVAEATTPEAKGVNFSFTHLTSLIFFNITLPQATTVDGVRLTADNPVFYSEGIIDLTGPQPSIKPSAASSSIQLDTKNIATTGPNQTLSIFMTMCPTDLRGQNVCLHIGHYNIALPEKKGPLMPGKAYKFTVAAKSNSTVDINDNNIEGWESQSNINGTIVI